MWRLIGIGAVALVAVVLAVLALRRDHAQYAEPPEVAEFQQRLGEGASAAGVSAAIQERAKKQLASAGVRQQEAKSLADLTVRLLHAYQQDNPEDFHTVLLDMGLEPDQRSNAESVELWQQACSMHFVDAVFYPDQISWHAAVVDGRPTVERESGSAVVLPGELYIQQPLETPRGPHDVVDPRQAGATQVLLLLPSQLRDATGTATLCQLELTFTKRPADGKWLLSGSALRNVPKERFAIAAPPIR